MKSVAERLKDGSVKNESTGCIEWVKHINPDGYGMLWFNRGANRSHRVSWIVHNGEIPEGMHVLHKCDNRKCINPEHLFLGTNADNVADKVSKDRQARNNAPKGEDSGKTILTNDDVLMIKHYIKRGDTYRSLAMLFGVTIGTICNIKKGRSWSHLELGVT